jgi:galactonate dehydratase
MRRPWQTSTTLFAAAADSSTDPLAITGLRGWRLREPVSGRRYTVVRLETRRGLTGFGEGGPARAADILDARAALAGRTANETEFVRRRLTASPPMEAAVSNAMLDILGKSTKIPVYQFLGGPTRYKARVLATLEGGDEAALGEPLQRAMQRGFKAFTLPIAARDSMTTLQAHVDNVRKRVERVRSMAGPNTDFVLDAAGSQKPGEAAAIATALEKVHLLWFDEPTSVLTSDALAKITDESVMPVGLGRHVHDVAVFQNLLRWGCIDLLRPSLGLNSAPKIRRMAAVAETHYVDIAPYHDGGPIGTVAGLHLAASLPNFFIQQVPQPVAARDRDMRMELTSGDRESAQDGFTGLLNRPGLGIEVDEKALGKYSEETI